MPFLLALVTLLAILALLLGIERITAPDTGRVQERLLRYGARRLVVVDEETGETRNRPAAAAALTATVSRAIQNRSFAQNLQADLARANVKLTVGEFFTIQFLVAFAAGAVGAFVFRNPIALPVLGLVGFQLPRMWVGRQKAGRLKAFNSQLGDTITLMSNSLRAGMSLMQSMEMVSRSGNPPISEEFYRVVREIGLGVSSEDALLHLVDRVRSDDLDLMVTAVLVQHEVGGNLAKILDTIAFTIRERIKIKGEIRAITGQQRMAGYILAGLPIFVGGVLSLIAPRYIFSLFTPGPWLVLPIYAVVSIFLGFTIIQKVVAIEV